MTKRDIGLEILEGIHDIKAHKAGKITLRTHTLKEPDPPKLFVPNLNYLRRLCRLDGSQPAYCSGLGTGPSETKRPCRSLLRIAEQKLKCSLRLRDLAGNSFCLFL